MSNIAVITRLEDYFEDYENNARLVGVTTPEMGKELKKLLNKESWGCSYQMDVLPMAIYSHPGFFLWEVTFFKALDEEVAQVHLIPPTIPYPDKEIRTWTKYTIITLWAESKEKALEEAKRVYANYIV